MNVKQREKEDAIKELREILSPGDTVFTKLQHCSRSGMSRVIMPIIIKNDEPQYIGWLVAKACGDTYSRTHEGVKVGGCGMDMGFALVYELSRTLFREGFKVEGRGRNGDTSGWDKDGGYALKQRWL